MKELTLVCMAAGMGSRFGGLKQITPVDEDGNFLVDYSVYDAIKAGFKKVVFIIKEEHLQTFKETIGIRLENIIPVEYVFQKIEDVPNFVTIPEKRTKPWGTVHAVLSAKNAVKGPFAVINADDFYGFNSYKIVADFLNENNTLNEHISIPYPFNKVDSKFGFVKRGVLFYNKDNVEKIIECNVGYENNVTIAKPLDEREAFIIEENHPVSMNLFGFKPELFLNLETYFNDFVKKNSANLETSEALISDFLEEYVKEKKLTLKYKTSNGLWLGMTYKEDLEIAKETLRELKKQGEYPEHLWIK